MKDQRLVFLTSFSYPTHHAHPTHGLLMARAWNKLFGDSFTFVIGGRTDDPALVGISCVRAFGSLAPLMRKLHLRTAGYFFWLPYFLLHRGLHGKSVVVFTNDPRLAIVAAFFKPLFRYAFAFESHGEYSPRLRRSIYGASDKIIFVTRALREVAISEQGSVEMKSVVVPNASDVEQFLAVSKNPREMRAELKLPLEGTLIGFLGRVRPGGVDKGVPFMIRSLARLPEEYRMLFVGGTEEEIREMQALARTTGVFDRIAFVPFCPLEELPRYAAACDILAYVPEDAGSAFHRIETSPMKLFDYMAARRPIVVSDTPAIREILDESCAVFCTAGSSESFVEAIERERSEVRVDTAFERIKNNTWHKRAKRIAEFCHA